MKILTATEVKHRWPELAPRFSQAMQHGDRQHDAEYILHGSLNGTVTVAEAPCGVMALHIVDDRVHIIAAQGRLDRAEITQGMAELSTAAATLGIKYLTLHGRRGWQRILSDWQLQPDGVLRGTI